MVMKNSDGKSLTRVITSYSIHYTKLYDASVRSHGTLKVYTNACTSLAQKYTAAAVPIAGLLTPMAFAARISAANSTRFSTALVFV